ncbi:MAG TPA: HEAT repeat domain-containing protein [Tepidisphaeraceae bacterium]|jgi:HEAT repeat protein|nr:HEAT repeat domain-containing protein [Tepidisphaeraceae bacterium]
MKPLSLLQACVVGLLGISIVGCVENPPTSVTNERFTGDVRKVPAPPAAKPETIDPELKARARKEILTDARLKDPLIRAHAIEAIRDTGGGSDGAEAVIWALNDPEAVVRFSACLAAGELKLESAHRPLLKLLQDPDPSVQVASRFALHRLRDKRFSHDLEKFARNPDIAIRGDTAMVLGMLGEPSAMNILREMQFDKDASVRLQAQEAMWRLGSKDAREALIAATYSHYVDDQAIAYLALAEPRDPSVLPYVRPGLSSPFNQIDLIAARAAGMLGSDAGYSLALDATMSTDPSQRVLAAFALGAIGRSDAQAVLAKLMQDPVIDIRVAASTALLQLQDGR